MRQPYSSLVVWVVMFVFVAACGFVVWSDLSSSSVQAFNVQGGKVGSCSLGGTIGSASVDLSTSDCGCWVLTTNEDSDGWLYRVCLDYEGLRLVAREQINNGGTPIDVSYTYIDGSTQGDKWMEQPLNYLGPLLIDETPKTIASGAITYTGPIRQVLTAESGGVDDLTTINSPPSNGLVILQAASGQTITVKDADGGAGNIELSGTAADCVLDSQLDRLWLDCDAGDCLDIGGCRNNG